MKVTISVECSTEDEALEVVQRLNGVGGDAAEVAEAAPKAKKVTPTAKAAAATKAAFEDEPKAAAAKGKGKKKVPTVDETKKKIGECAGDITDPEVAAQVKAYINSFGVPNVSGMSDEQRVEAFNGAEDYFAGEDGDDEEEDPLG